MANEIEKGTLYVVATPIGNLSDLSERAVKVLSEVDFIAAEDTRVTGKLLLHIGTKKPMISYHEHNKAQKGDVIVSRILSGESCALVSDAGTPAISDPGEDLVKKCAEAGVPVYAVPGPCAAVCALSVSGLPTSKFFFEGFLPTAKKERRERLDTVKNIPATLIFYEAPHKLTDTLQDLFDALGDRKISLVKEITKLNEKVLRTTLSGAIEHYQTNAVRGEFVLVVEGASEDNTGRFWDGLPVREHVDYYVAEGLEKMEAIKRCARDRKIPKNAVYKEYNGL